MLLFLFLNDFCQTYYLNIYQAELHEIYRVGTIMTVYERFEVIFRSPNGRCRCTQFCGPNPGPIHTTGFA